MRPSLRFIGLAILGWGGVGAFFAHPALTAVAVATVVISVVSMFTQGNLSTGEREDRGNRWVLAAFAVLGVLAAYLPALTDRLDVWTLDGDAVRWTGVVVYVLGGALRIWPVFVLGNESGRLFKPLAFTKTFAMAAASVLSVTAVPVLMYYFITARVLPKRWGRRRNLLVTLAAMLVPAAMLFAFASAHPLSHPYRWWVGAGWAVLAGMLLIPQKIIHEDQSPVSRLMQWLYEPFFRLAMRHPYAVLVVAWMLSYWLGWGICGQPTFGLIPT